MQINDELKINFPEEFHVMLPEETEKLRRIAEGPGVCIKDPDRHMVMTVGWKQIGLLAGWLLKPADLARGMAAAIRKAQKPFGYHGEEKAEVTCGGVRAEGIRYRYEVQGTNMASVSCITRVGKRIYDFHLYTREALWEENRELWERILAAGEWAETE